MTTTRRIHKAALLGILALALPNLVYAQSAERGGHRAPALGFDNFEGRHLAPTINTEQVMGAIIDGLQSPSLSRWILGQSLERTEKPGTPSGIFLGNTIVVPSTRDESGETK